VFLEGRQTVLVPSAKAHIYSLKEDHAIYVATVAVFSITRRRAQIC
jgi:hypothetical protein